MNARGSPCYTNSMIIAVDTGGTKTLVARLSDEGTIETTTKFPTPPVTDDYIRALRGAIHEVNSDNLPITVVSLGLPGVIKDDVVIWCGNLPWQNFDVTKQLQQHFPDATILVENDANLGGLGETRIMAPMPVSSLYVTISTGIGTGIITNGSIDPGLRLSEGGHMMVEFDGKVQLWEHFASGKAVYDTYGTYAHDITSEKIWRDIADRISRGFLVMIPLLQPDVIVIGGSLGTYFDQYSAPLLQLLKDRLPDHIPCPRFVAAVHPEEAVIYGAYYHAIDQPVAR